MACHNTTDRILPVWISASVARMMWRRAGCPPNEYHIGPGAALIGRMFDRMVFHVGWDYGTDAQCAAAWDWRDIVAETRRAGRHTTVEYGPEPAEYDPARQEL